MLKESDSKVYLIPIGQIEENNGQIQGLPTNPRTIKKDDFLKLVKSIKETPQMLSHRQLILYPLTDNRYVAIGGNQRLRALKELKYDEVPCSVLDKNTSVDELKAILIKDNNSFGDWDWDAIANEWDSEPLNDWGMSVWDVNDDDNSDKESESDDDKEDATEDNVDFHPVLDILFPSDNDYEIPTLLADMQGEHVELPVTPWGANSRLRKDVSTYHFYVDDYRFENLWKDPSALINSGVKAIVEPNCSCHDQTPIAYGLQLIYKKRWLARYCQEYGIKVYVDLNVADKFISYNKLGIPKGYNAFFTRGLIGWMESLKSDLKVAQEISGLEVPNLVVYGGGKEVQKFCQEHGLLYIQDFINAKKKDNG